MNKKPYCLVVRGVLIEKDRVLLCQRSPNSLSHPSMWEFPGGKVSQGESFSDALVREFKEETGLIVSLEKVIGSSEWEYENYKAAYLFMLVKRLGGEFQISSEHVNSAWFSTRELSKAALSPQLSSLRTEVINIIKSTQNF